MNATSPHDAGAGIGGGSGAGPPTLDQMLWFGLNTTPGVMLSWSMLGSTLVMLLLAKIIADTVKYYDYSGFRGKAKTGTLIACGLIFAFIHSAITCVQTFKLGQHAYTDYASIAALDNYGVTTANFIGGMFNFAAAIYFTIQVFALSGRKWWLLLLIMVLNTGTLALTVVVGVEGYRAPKPEIESIEEYRDYNIGRVPFYISWGVTSFVGDAVICISMTYYLLRMKDSIVHRQKSLLWKLETLVLGSILPSVIFCLCFSVSVKSSKASIGDYRRVLVYLHPILYLMSPLHSIVSRIELREYIKNRDDDSTNPDSFPLSPQLQLSSQWQGQESTIHIDPNRGKTKRSSRLEHEREGEEKKLPAVIGLRAEIPCKRTFGAPDQTTDPTVSFAQPPRMSKASIKRKKLPASALAETGDHIPGKRTFGAVDTPPDEIDLDIDDADACIPRSPTHPYANHQGVQDSEEEIWQPNLFYEGQRR